MLEVLGECATKIDGEIAWLCRYPPGGIMIVKDSYLDKIKKQWERDDGEQRRRQKI